MNLDQDLRTLLVSESERQDVPRVDVNGILARGRARRRRRTALVAGLAAAVVVAIGFGAFGLNWVDRAAPEPAGPSTTKAAPILGDADCLSDDCLEPGTYAIELGNGDDGRPLRVQMTVDGGGWDANAYEHRITRSGGLGTVTLNVYEPRWLAGARPCDAEGASVTVLGATVEDVVGRLTHLPHFVVVEGPTPNPYPDQPAGSGRGFGPGTVHLQVRADLLRCELAKPSAQYNLADIFGGNGATDNGGDSDIDLDRPVLIDFWVLELGGKTIMVEARQEGAPTQAAINQLDQVRRSLEFVVQN